MADEFHHRHGRLVFLSNGNRTARRRNPGAEFNHGLIFSKHTLRENEIFEIRVDRRMSSWSGSLAIGVTTANPSNIEIPSSACGLKNGYWIMSGVSVIKDGVTVLDYYGKDLDELDEGDRVGVCRLSDGCLHVSINGNDLGVACRDVPATLYAVVDLYGKCVEVSSFKAYIPAEEPPTPSTASVAFHPHCGSLVKLCNNNRTAERQRPNEEFKNSVVLTDQPLENDKLFEIRVEEVTDLWAGSLELGVTSHEPAGVVLPPTMTMMPTGTWIWSASSIIVNGKELMSDYSDISLETIKVGDKVGILRKSDGSLFFFLNGVNLGIAVIDLPATVYGVVDLYGAAVRASICGTDLVNVADTECNEAAASVDNASEESSPAPLLFHPQCGMAVSLLNSNCTAFRPRALEEFNHAVILTNRPLNPGELFEVYIDTQVDKWAGSLELGLTTHTPETLEFPSTMTNVITGTWIMSGGGMMINGSTVIEDYGNNLDDLKVGDTVGVIYNESGSLHFFVNGEDMGEAATNVPGNVFGVVDLYGRSAQATITNGRPRQDVAEGDTSNQTPVTNQEPAPAQPENTAPPPPPTNENWFTLSSKHGDQVAVSQDCRVALRINPLVEFNNAVVMSQRPLRDNELFEVIVLTLVDRWSGSLEAGVTVTSPGQMSFPTTMTDLNHDTWMLSGSSVLQDGVTIQNGYACDLDKLMEGHRLGIMRKAGGTLHFFVNGEDCGVAASSVPSGVHAIIDLYGRCVQLAIYDEDYIRRAGSVEMASAETQTTPIAENEKEQSCGPCSFHPCCGRNITLRNSRWVATRSKGFSDGLLFSAKPLEDDEIFEIKVDRLGSQWSGSLSVGVTSCLLPMSNVPTCADQLRDGTWLMVESRILKDGKTVKENYGPSLNRLQVGTRIGLQRRRDGTLHIYVNGEDQGVAATDVPRMVFGLVDLYGVVESVSVVTQTDQNGTPTRTNNIDSEQIMESEGPQISEVNESTQKTRHMFTRNCGQHVRLDNKRMLARRIASYNHGVILSDSPLPDNDLFQIRITKLDIRWSGSLMVGITDQDPDSISLTSTSNCMKICPWIVVNNAVYINGNKVFEGLEPGLDRLRVGDSVGLIVDKDSRLRIVINGRDQGPVAEALPAKRYVVVDLYGCCQEVCIVATADQEHSGCELKDDDKAAKDTEVQNKSPCDYRQLCERFQNSLAIPDGYFNQESKFSTCYCQACHEARGEKQYEVSGDPARRYAQPVGWCQFGLGLPPRIKSLQVLDKWHVAFYGTQIGKIRKILDVGDLPMPGGSHHRSKSNSNKENEVPRLMVSPTVMCAACTTHVPAHQYRDVTTGKTYIARVAFRISVRPGSYSTGQCCTQETNELLPDHNLDTQELEWYLQEKGLVVLTALLMKIEPT